MPPRVLRRTGSERDNRRGDATTVSAAERRGGIALADGTAAMTPRVMGVAHPVAEPAEVPLPLQSRRTAAGLAAAAQAQAAAAAGLPPPTRRVVRQGAVEDSTE